MTNPWRDWATPTRIRVLAGGPIALVLVLATVLTAALAGLTGTLDTVGHRTGPQVEATSDLYFALSDMDAQVANVLLVGNAANLGTTRRQALDLYARRRDEADADLQQAATAGAGISPVLDPLGQYESLAGQAIELDAANPVPGRPGTAALDRYRQATDLMRTRLLPAAQTLTRRNAAVLDRSYTGGRSGLLTARIWTAVIGLALLAALAGSQLFLRRRFRRRYDRALLAATVLVVGLLLASTAQLSFEAERLRTAKEDAFGSVLALSQARAVSYNSNADESRFLLDPQRADQYQAAFAAESRQLVDLGDVGIAGYDAALAKALDAYRADHGDVRFTGYFGTEFRNITFPGERTAAERTVTAYQAYQRDDRRIRDLVRQGRLDDAIAFDTSAAPGGSDWAYGQYATALDALIGINRGAFSQSIAAGEDGLSGWTPALWATTAAVTGLVLLGVRRRLAEYR